MTARELTDWAAFEQEHGPVLAHDRLDIGLATVAYYVASAAGAKRSFTDFLPVWLRDRAREASVRRGFEKLKSLVGVRFPDADD